MQIDQSLLQTGSAVHVFDDVGDMALAPRVLSKTLAVRFDEETWLRLQEAAEARGMGPTTLVRAWVQERLGIDWQVGRLAPHSFPVPQEFEATVREQVVANLMQSLPQVADSVLQNVLSNLPGEKEAS